MSDSDGIVASLLAEILRDAYRYVPGIEQTRPTLVRQSRPRQLVISSREHGRDLLERVAAGAGFHRRHFDPALASERLRRLLALSTGLEATYARLGDECSRRALIEVLKLRVLGPHHARLALTPQAYRDKQAQADRELRSVDGTFDVSDPWFSPLSLYAVPVDGGETVALHSHSVDIVSVFLLGQYGYAGGATRVRAEPGDVVLDAGGCWGDTALYFASQVGPEGKVYTFEFDPESLEILRANLALNPRLAGRIEVVERALWDRSGETLGFVQAGRMTTLVGPDDAQPSTRPVSTITIDEFVEQEGLEQVDFLKMDVEGAELNLLRGARGSIERFAPKLGIAAYHKDDDLVRIPAAIVSLNPAYRLYLASFSPIEDETVLFADSPRATSLSSST
jgi:FkbM family methyltransferase